MRGRAARGRSEASGLVRQPAWDPDAGRAGPATLERLSRASAFNRWMYDRLAPWIGRRVIEVGSGIGNLSQFFVDRERVVLTDTEDEYLSRLQARFGHLPNVAVRRLELPRVPSELEPGSFDTVVGINVLEHVAEHREAVQAMATLLAADQGRLVLLVPALPALFGSLDQALGHYRRYTPSTLRETLSRAGLRVRHVEWFNLGGILGWWFAGKVLRRAVIPEGALAIYDRLVPLFRLERWLPWRIGQSLIAVGELR